MARKKRVVFPEHIPDSPARRFVDSAESSYQRLQEQHNGAYNSKPRNTGETPQAIQSPDENGASAPRPIAAAVNPARTEAIAAAIAAAVALGVKRPQVEYWASLAPPNSTSGQIVSFILRSRQ